MIYVFDESGTLLSSTWLSCWNNGNEKLSFGYYIYRTINCIWGTPLILVNWKGVAPLPWTRDIHSSLLLSALQCCTWTFCLHYALSTASMPVADGQESSTCWSSPYLEEGKKERESYHWSRGSTRDACRSMTCMQRAYTCMRLRARRWPLHVRTACITLVKYAVYKHVHSEFI